MSYYQPYGWAPPLPAHQPYLYQDTQQPSSYYQQEQQPRFCWHGQQAAPAQQRRQGCSERLPSVHRSSPEEFGWVHTGTNVRSKVEFYFHPETGAKLDYYPTTGTVKTMVDHPRQGKTQMFRRNLSDKQFERVLSNPRAHTGQGYQYKRTGGYGR